MIAAAITALKDRTGSSRQAILKYVCANYKVDAAKAGQHLRLALKAGIKKGSLKMAKESGKGAGKFKLVKVEKPRRSQQPRSLLLRKPPSPRRPLPRNPQRRLQPRKPQSQRRLPPRKLQQRKLKSRFSEFALCT